MNKILKRFVITFTLTVLFIMPVFSESWYLCLGSYKQEKNALALVDTLKANGVDAVIDNFVKNGDLYYRVYLADAYDNRDLARSKISEAENLPIIKKLKITGIWICVGSDKVAPAKETKAVPNPVVDSKSVSSVKKETKAEDITESLVIEPSVAKSTATTKKAPESKTTATKAVEEKTVEAAPVETKVVETKPAEPQISEPAKSTVDTTKSTETKSTKSSATTKTSSTTKSKTTQTKKTEKKPAEVKSVETKAVEEKPVETKVVEKSEEKVEEIKQEIAPETEIKAEKTEIAEPVVEENAEVDEPINERDMVAIARKLEAELRAAAENKSIGTVTSSETVEENKIQTKIPEEPAVESASEAVVENPVENQTEENNVEAEESEEAENAEDSAESEETPAADSTLIEETAKTPVEETASVTLAFEDTTNNVLKPDYSDEFLVSEEKPYTIYIHTYKNIEDAEYDKNRLESYSIPAFIVQNYDEKAFFEFKLYAGGFEKEEQAEEVEEELLTLGMPGVKFAHYSNVIADSKRFNDVVLNTTVKFYGFEEVKTPDTFSDYIKTVISKFPVNKDYQMEELVVFDVDQIYENEIENEYTEKLDAVIYQEENTVAAALGLFEDVLFDNQVTILVESGEDFTFDDVDKSNPRKITIGNETYNGYVYVENDVNNLLAINDEGTLVIKIIGNNVTAPLFNIYITTLFEDNYLYTLPNFRNALCSIPSKNAKVEKRDFIYLVLQKIEEEVAYDVGFEHYAAPLANLSWTWSYFNQNDSIVETMALNLNYDYVANKLFEAFQDRQLQYPISEENRPSYVPFVESWYTSNEEGTKQDLNIMLKSFILQLDVNDDKFTERNMVDFVEDMQLLSY